MPGLGAETWSDAARAPENEAPRQASRRTHRAGSQGQLRTVKPGQDPSEVPVVRVLGVRGTKARLTLATPAEDLCYPPCTNARGSLLQFRSWIDRFARTLDAERDAAEASRRRWGRVWSPWSPSHDQPNGHPGRPVVLLLTINFTLEENCGRPGRRCASPRSGRWVIECRCA